MGSAFSKTSVAVHWCWVTAQLHEKQIFIGAIAVTQGYCEPVMQSSTEQWGVHFCKTSVAVHWCWVTAQLYEQQIFVDAMAVTEGYSEPVLPSSTEQWGVQILQNLCCSALVMGHCTAM